MKRVLVGAWFVGAMLLGSVRAQAGTITVTSGGDAGGPCPGVACTLRQAILDAIPGDTIDFAPGLTTIDLTTAELVINKNLTISGPGADLLSVRRSTVGGTPNFRIFNILSGNVTISGLTISNGRAPDPGGGGILNSNGSTVNISSSTLSGNQGGATGGGGGIFNPSGGTANITNSTLTGNGGSIDFGSSDGGGGGIRNKGGLVTITNSTISDNGAGATSGGGGVHNSNGGVVNITNSTLALNRGTGFTSAAGGAGGIRNNGGTVTARNTIIAQNVKGGQPYDFDGTLASQGYNLIGNTTNTTITGTSTGNQLNVDPMLGPLQGNGGPTFTQALLPGSPAIDAGHSSGSTIDQRGFIRPVDDPAYVNATGGDGGDIGAYEGQAPVPSPTPTPTPTPTFPPPTPTPGMLTVNSGADSGGICPGATCTLRQAILVATPGDIIDFAPGLKTIVLTSDELVIDKNLTVSGPGADLLAVQRPTAGGGPEFRIFNIASGNVNISGVTIRYGSTISPISIGAGIFNQTTGTLTVTNCTISTNFASHNGGGIYNDSPATVIIINSDISGNGVTQSGGGLYNLGTATITNSTIYDNFATLQGPGGAGNMGGGIYNAGVVTITNSTISGNDAQNNIIGRGAGIYNHTGGTTNLTNATISNNFSCNDGGGGIFNNNGGIVTARNTIIAANTDCGAIGSHDFHGALTSEGFNLIGNNTASVIVGAQITDQIGTAGSPIDPRLGILQDNGGSTQTHALLSDSTAIDQGHSSGSNIDQRGFIRPVDNPSIPNVTSGDGGDIGAFEVQAPAPTPTPPPTPTATPSSTPAAQALNLSTRMRVSIDDQAGIGGLIITGTGPKHALIRAIGPSITSLSGVLADPVLELHGPGAFVTINNDNWRDDPAQEAAILTTGLAPSNNLEAAIDVILSPGAYTAVVRGKNNTSGIALVEVYDLSPAVLAKLVNISTRAFVGPGDNLVIAGFILGGQSGNDNIVVRGLGPSLVPAGLPNGIPNPTLELRDNNGALLAANNDWQSNSGQRAELIAAGLAPVYASEAALAVTLPPGSYTALLADLNPNAIGYGLVEVYDRGAGPPIPFPSPTPPNPTPTLPPPPTTPPPPPITPTPTPTPPPGVTPSPTPSATVTPSATPTPSPIMENCMQNFDGVNAPALPAGWSGSWVTSTIDPDSPPNDAFVPNPATTGDESLFSPFIQIYSASAVLVFRNNFNTEHNPPPAEVFYDGFVLEVSTDGGTTYNDILNAGGVFVSGPYTGEISGLGNNPLAGRMAWSGNSGGYIDTIINLPTSFNGQTIRLKFRMGTDMVIGAPGVRIDGFYITYGFCL